MEELISDIAIFLRDPHHDRWKKEIISSSISRAKEHLTLIYKSEIAKRRIARQESIKMSQSTDDKTVQIPLKDGVSTYRIHDNDLIAIKSVFYDCCGLRHDMFDCDECSDGKAVRSYSVSNMPKGSLKVSPTPREVLKLCSALQCSNEACYDNNGTVLHKAEHIDEYYLLGWGYNEQIRPYIETIITSDEDTPEEEIKIELGHIEVVYQVKTVPTYANDDAEIRDALINDDLAIKYWVLEELRRHDDDVTSMDDAKRDIRSFDNRVKLIMEGFAESYLIDDVAKIKNQETGYKNNDVTQQSIVDAQESEAIAMREAKDIKARDNKEAMRILQHIDNCTSSVSYVAKNKLY